MSKTSQKGFSIIETLIVMAVFLSFLGLLSMNLINIEPRASINLATSTIIADIRKQQLKAMTGDTFNNLTADFGIYLESSRYILFPGNSYQGGAAGNSVFNLADNISITDIGFPSSIIVFQKGSGEISSGGNSFTVRNSVSSELKTITFNKMGAVIQVQ